jgi:hypothetical protein
LESAGYVIQDAALESMWMPVEIVRAIKPAVLRSQELADPLKAAR